MSSIVDPPALRRLVELEHQRAPERALPPPQPEQPAVDVGAPVAVPVVPKMGYQPGLDGLRAVSVIVVILYHIHRLNVSWLPSFQGGFFGVEVFFVVSGYLITSLLIEEWGRTGRTDLRAFWIRRGRRLLPALFTMLAVVAVLASAFRTDTLGRFKYDLPGALTYWSNWWQMFTGGYGAALAVPPLLMHLWSLAVEEQWYLVWPVVFAFLMRRVGGRASRLFAGILVASVASALLMGLLFQPDNDFRINLIYLATFTRAAGILLGAALAMRWTPWRWSGAGRRHLVWLDVAGAAAMVVLALSVVNLGLRSWFTYHGGMYLVSISAAVAIAAVVHPGARLMRRTFGSTALVVIGKRSYGLYLWSWPIMVLFRAGLSVTRLVLALATSVVASELCYRFVETPVRTGTFAAWWRALRTSHGEEHQRWVRSARWYAVAAAAVLVPVAIGLTRANYVDPNTDTGNNNVVFDASALGAGATVVTAAGGGNTATTAATGVAGAGTTTGAPATSPTTGGAATSTATGAPATSVPTAAVAGANAPLPRRVVVVGDSQAHALAINLPKGIGSTFAITDGSVEGCGVWDQGTVVTARAGFDRSFGNCKGWADKWGRAAGPDSHAELGLVVIGAWDVFDVDTSAGLVKFGTPQGDQAFEQRLQTGIDAMKAAGTHVALLQVSCMRPVDAKGAGVPPLPERADDQRTQHLSSLMQQMAAADPQHVTYVAGPAAWCNDPAIAQSTAYRWDGVHVYKPGANLIYETIAPALLQIPVPA